MTFKVGDRIRRVSNAALWAPIGYETVVMGVPGDLAYTDINGDIGVILRVCDWEVIQEGPVRTVTRQEIVPGTYDGVGVDVHPDGMVQVKIAILTLDPDRLERAAAVLTALAGALRDGE